MGIGFLWDVRKLIGDIEVFRSNHELFVKARSKLWRGRIGIGFLWRSVMSVFKSFMP